MSIRYVLLALILLVALSGTAIAAEYGTTSVTFSPGYYLNMDYTSPYSSYNGGFVGQIIASFSNMNPVINLNSDVFCVDPQIVYFNTSYNYSIVDLADIPNAGPGPMGADKADYLNELWGRFHNQVNSNVTGAAFQLSLWEIVFDNQQTDYTQWDTTTGAFYASGNADATNLANNWLAQLDGQGPKATLYGLSHADAQDLIVNPVPEPSAFMALGLSSLSMIGLALRKRRR